MITPTKPTPSASCRTIWVVGMRILFQIALVAFGSSLGGLLRWGVTEAAGYLLGTAFPWGTLFINLSGSLFLGWFSTVIAERLLSFESAWLRPVDLRLLVAVGFTGAYTTFSTYEADSRQLLGNGNGFAGITYLLGSVFFGLLAVRGGVFLAQRRRRVVR
jgi:CrcB protein